MHKFKQRWSFDWILVLSILCSDYFPYNHFDDDDFYFAVIEGMLDCSFRLHEINSKIFTPFEINVTVDTLFSDIDPDYQYYANLYHNSNLNCDYHFEDNFRCKLDKKDESRLPLFHLNVKSISKHYDEMELYLKSLDFKFLFYWTHGNMARCWQGRILWSQWVYQC